MSKDNDFKTLTGDSLERVVESLASGGWNGVRTENFNSVDLTYRLLMQILNYHPETKEITSHVQVPFMERVLRYKRLNTVMEEIKVLKERTNFIQDYLRIAPELKGLKDIAALQKLATEAREKASKQGLQVPEDLVTTWLNAAKIYREEEESEELGMSMRMRQAIDTFDNLMKTHPMFTVLPWDVLNNKLGYTWNKYQNATQIQSALTQLYKSEGLNGDNAGLISRAELLEAALKLMLRKD